MSKSSRSVNRQMRQHEAQTSFAGAGVRRALSATEFAAGIRGGDRAILARAITLVESTNAEHQALAQDILNMLLPESGKALRIGLTGVPGVGKSTAIDQLGINLTGQGRKVAVLAVDPTSSRTGGSILGDKTRMARLSVDPNAFVRPSPTGGTLGGVARKTRETIILCEAFGFDTILVETVGVGQSETTVAQMVDVFVFLALPGAGDELQGIKKGVLEIADIIAVNKADGGNRERAQRAAADYRGALNILTAAEPGWTPPVLLISGLNNEGLDKLWAAIEEHNAMMRGSGRFEERRRRQQVAWMRELLDERLRGLLRRDDQLASRLKELEAEVGAGTCTAVRAVDQLMAQLLAAPAPPGDKR